jgi:hypothetical protein
MGRVAEKEKSAVSSDKDPGRTDGLDVEAATEVASGVTSDALKVPVVYTVTVKGGGTYVTVTDPSQTDRHEVALENPQCNRCDTIQATY